MSFVIDENAVRRIMEERGGNAYTVTASNLRVFAPETDPAANPLYTMGVFGTTAAVTLQPQMSPDTIGKLLDLRRQIVGSGAHLMTTDELDNEVSERKRQLPGD